MSQVESLSESDLIDAFKTGDGDAFAYIYDRYAGTVFSCLQESGLDRPDAIEATHDTFIEAATRLEGLEIPDDLETWILGIAGFEDIDVDAVDPVPTPPALRVRVLSKVDKSLAIPEAPLVDRPEWTTIAVFAAATLLIGLIGWGVSAALDGSGPQPTTPAAEPAPVVVNPTTATTTLATPSTTQPPTPTTAAPPAAPASLEASTDTVDIGENETTAQFELRNTGGEPGEWQMASSSEAIAVSAGGGEIAPGEAVTIEVEVDREQLPEGDLSETLTVNWSGDEIEIDLVGTNEANPIIHNPQASPAAVEVSNGDCPGTRTTISARIRDTSSLETVVVRWSPDGNGEQETEMESVGNDMFEGVVGPFTVAQATEVRIVAFDDRGNAGGASTAVNVNACP